MSSRKQKKLQQLLTPDSSSDKGGVSIKSVERSKHSSVYVEKPIYTVFIMIAAILALSFLFKFIMNTVVTQICIANDASLKNNSEALIAASNLYIDSHPEFNIISRMTVNLAGLLSVLILFKRIEKNEIGEMGVCKSNQRGADIGLAVLSSVIALTIVYNILLAFGYIRLSGSLVISKYQIYWGIDIILTCVFEELFFRGYLIYKLKRYGKVAIYILTTVIFVLYKGLPSTSVPTYITFAVMNAFLLWATIKYKSVWFALTFRLVWTFISGIVLSVYADFVPGIIELSEFRKSFISGTASGFENGFAAAFVLGVCFFAVRFLLTHKPDTKERRLHSDGTIH